MNVDQLIALLLRQDSQAEVYALSAPYFDDGVPSIGRFLSKRRVAGLDTQEGSTDLCIFDQDAQAYLQEWEDEEGA